MARQFCRGIPVLEELGWIDAFLDGAAFVPVTLGLRSVDSK